VGPGRGIGLMYLLFAAAMALLALIALRTPALARFDEQVPDAAPDDLIGFEARQRRLTSATEAREPRRPVGVVLFLHKNVSFLLGLVGFNGPAGRPLLSLRPMLAALMSRTYCTIVNFLRYRVDIYQYFVVTVMGVLPP
jgi:hypothetical protein